MTNKAVHLHGLLVQFPMCMMSLSSRFPGSCETGIDDSLEAFGIGQSLWTISCTSGVLQWAAASGSISLLGGAVEKRPGWPRIMLLAHLLGGYE